MKFKINLWLGLIFLTVFLAGCGGNKTESEAEVVPTPTQGAGQRVSFRLSVDRSIPSLIDRHLELQVVELTNGVIAPEAVVVASAVEEGVGHTQGLPTEWSRNVNVSPESGKEYGLRAGIFDSAEKKVMLLNGECTGGGVCRLFPNGAAQVYQVQMNMAVDEETYYQAAMPAEIRARCQLVPDGQSCGMTRTMQYYDTGRDTCFPAAWGGCGEIKPFRNAGECIQSCRRQWP